MDDLPIEDLKNATIIAKPFVKSFIDAMIKPKIKSLEEWQKKKRIQNKLVDNFFESKFTEYLTRLHKNFSTANILIFPNQQISLKEIYHPLTLVSSRNSKSYKVGNGKPTYLDKYKKIVISDAAGMGKSTLSKWITLKLIESNYSIPIFVELRNLSELNLISDEICKQLDPINGEFDKELLNKFLELGNFTIILDGFDEIAKENYESVIKDIRSFTSKTFNNNYILTSRPESSTSVFGDFQLFNIRRLTIDESYALLRKFDKISKLNIVETLIRDLENKFEQIESFLGNPFLTSLLYRTYTYSREIPIKKNTFYYDVYMALYKSHDLSKGWIREKKSGLDVDDFFKVLSHLAFESAKRLDTQYSRASLVKYIDLVNLKLVGVEVNAESFIDDILNSVPLFLKDGTKLKWAHKSIQDYFVACYISASQNKREIIKKIHESDRADLFNTLEFLYEIEYALFQELVILPTLNDFVNFCSNTKIEVDGVDRDSVNVRKSIMYLGDFVLAFTDVDIYKPEQVPFVVETLLEGRTLKWSQMNLKRGYLYLFESVNSGLKIQNFLYQREENVFLNSAGEISYNNTEIFNFLNDGFHKLIVDNESILNNPAYFNIVNAIISDKFVLFDYDKCIDRITEIRKYMDESKEFNELEGI